MDKPNETDLVKALDSLINQALEIKKAIEPARMPELIWEDEHAVR